MSSFARFVIFFFICSGFILRCGDGTGGTAAIGPYAQFIAGISLLRSISGIKEPHLRNARFRELKVSTGLCTEEVSTFLKNIRDDPRKGMELYETMQKVITPEPDSTIH